MSVELTTVFADTQIAPAFAVHPLLARAVVLVHPPPLPLAPTGTRVPWTAFFGIAGRPLWLDAAVHALRHERPDPNLPPGVSLEDVVSAGRPEALGPMMRRVGTAEIRAWAVHGADPVEDPGPLDAFAVLATFARDAEGAPRVESADPSLAAALTACGCGVVPEVRHLGRGGAIELLGRQYPIEETGGGRFAIHGAPGRSHTARRADRLVLEALVASAPERWHLERRRASSGE